MDEVAGIELVGELGRGAQSVVYRGRRDGRDYAVKVMISANDVEGAAGFRREAALLACLDAASVARIYEVGEVGGRPYLIMDLVTGRSLADTIAGGRLDVDRAVELGRQVAVALDAAHRAGVVHRDVKPQNIMIRPDSSACLIDFGLAGRTGRDVTDTAVGTFAYSAPEQVGTLRRAVDGRADLYALGIVLFECLTGELPFTGADAGELIHRHLSTPAPAVASLRPDCPPALAAIVAKLLHKDPDDRYQHAAGLVDDLGRVGGPWPFPLDAGRSTGTDTALVGRSSELADLLSHWSEAQAGRGGMVVLSGPPGVGKSRLVRELAATLRAGGAAVLHGGFRADAVPLQPLREAIAAYVRGRGSTGETALHAAAGGTSDRLAALSPVFAGRADTEAPTQHQFAEAAAALLAGLAAAEGGALLHLDDGQWCDEVTRSVLHRLGPGLPGSRLLVVLTTRDAAAPWPAATEVPLRVLDAAAVAELAGLQLGSAAAPPDLVDQLTARSGGNPLAVVEYVRAIVDAGLLSPSWGAWRLDRAGLDALALPDDVMDLLARRVDGLRPQARQMLAVAAIAGGRFTAALLEATVAPAATAATASGSTDVAAVLADAVTAQLIEPVPGGYAFLHERIRDALLDTLDDADRRRLHQRVAEHLDAVAEPGTADVYAVARHYLCGETDHDRHRVYRAVRAAGSFALSQCATADAVELLGQAADIAASAGIVPDTGFHIELGVAASRTGRFGLADEHLTVALDLEREPRRRARIYGYLAESRHLRGEGDQMADLANRGLAEVGYPVPRNPLLLALSTVLLFLLGLAVAKLPRRLRTVTGVRRERYLLRASLSYTGAHGAAMAIRMPLVGAYALRSLYLVNRLGPGAEYAEVVASLGTLANVIGLHRVTAWALERATAAAAGTSDAATIARTEWIKGIAYDGAPPMGMDTGRSMRRALDRHGQAMTAADFLTGAALLGDLGLFRGDLADVGEWLRRSAVRAPEPSEVLGNPFAVIHPQAAALAGRPAEAAAGLAKVEEFLRGAPNNRGQQINVAIAAVHIAVEQGEVGAVFDEAVARFEALHLKPAQILSTQRKAWMHIAFGRLAQATDGAAHGGPAPAGAADRLRTAERAVAAFGRAANGPMLTAFHHVALANLRHLHGDHEGALRRLTRLESRTGRFDVPLLQYETALVRARAYRALDRPGPCRREAAWALALATEHGWLTRARRVRDEFGLDAAPTGQTSATVVSARGASATLSLHQRRLHAVHQVSRAAATILDPDELARVTVGQIVEIFGAERAFLFLLDNGTVRPYLGRDSAGTELADLTGYGSTLVERVAGTGEPLVVTGSEEGAALGSRSVVVHGLRSIMIAPLLLKNRLVGVVYLDSRAARGIFTVDDLETLAELTNQVALALETARAAQLEVAVHAAQRERDLAETMRDLISELNTTLAPDEVAGRLTAVLGRVVPADRVVLLLHDNTGRLTVAGLATPGTHRAGGPATPAEVPADIDPATAAALDSGTPQRVSGAGHPQPMPHLLGPAVTTWMTIPLTVRDEHRGLLIVGGHEPYTEAHAEIAAALAAQATVALDNARLFNQVADLASRDALTGLANRRHFTAQAAHHLAGNRTVAAIMADIDHFKAVNDTHGHSVGDEVIREVGHRLSGCLRDSDIICRYGGEEFAILLPNITLTGADQVAARLHQTVTATPIDTQIGPLPVTVSVGVYTPTEPGEELHHLLTQADEALYEAKRGGRNQVVTRGPTQLLHNGCHQVAPLP